MLSGAPRRPEKSNFSFPPGTKVKKEWGAPGFLFHRNQHPKESAAKLRFVLCWMLMLGMALTATAKRHAGPTIEELKAQIASAKVADRARICLQIAQKQLEEVDKLYGAGEISQAQPGLTDVVAYAQLARDYSIQSHKRQKQTEIAVRGMTRKLTDLEHTLGQQDQQPVKDALDQLERVRDDLLSSMFKKREDK